MLRAVSMLGCSEETAPEDLIINAAYRGIPFGAARWIIVTEAAYCYCLLTEAAYKSCLLPLPIDTWNAAIPLWKCSQC